MILFTIDEINNALAQYDYDLRKKKDQEYLSPRWMDQKCTPDVLSTLADCIVQFVKENNDLEYFTSKQVWFSPYSVENVVGIYKKPDPTEEKTKNEYDKYFQQPMELLAYAGILERKPKKKKQQRNYYRVNQPELLEYIALRERNALTFLQCYLLKFLEDSGMMEPFNRFFEDRSKTNYDKLREQFEGFIHSYTYIEKHFEVGRIFAKVINPLAFLRNTEGTEGGRVSSHKITYDMLMYNRDNFRDIYSDKPKDMTRSEYEKIAKIHINKSFTKYMSKKAKDIVRQYNEQFHDGITEVTYDKQHIGDMATHIHHIFPEADFPTICHYIENLIALTPTQHLNYAHPNGNTQKIDREYQHICLLAKSDTIRDDIEHHNEPIYSFEKFLYVLFIGLERDTFSQIENGDYDGLVTAINLAYSV